MDWVSALSALSYPRKELNRKGMLRITQHLQVIEGLVALTEVRVLTGGSRTAWQSLWRRPRGHASLLPPAAGPPVAFRCGWAAAAGSAGDGGGGSRA